MARRRGAIIISSGRQLAGNRALLLQTLTAAVRCQHTATEHRLLSERRWRADLAWPAHMVAVEFQGGAHIRGHHVRGQGFEDDCEKLLVCSAAGWTILPITWRMVERRLVEVASYLDLVIGCEDPTHRTPLRMTFGPGEGWDPKRREWYPA